MSVHPYEYKVLTEYITPDEQGRYLHFSHIEDQEGLTLTLQEVFNHLPDSVPEGWEVNSHNITISRNTLIVTILLRKLRVS
ncbi:MAG: hypothetical protein JW762_09325 [Dehalococcoidales bacterium]|nr:hypothetical protein [Dehalococcoidales bacterium]